MKYDLDIIDKYINDGLLICQSHPTLPLKIYNYSRNCQFEKKWDDITLAMRGTVLDTEGNLIAKSYDKFFNIEEFKTIPNESFDIYEKLDGSLGILFNYNGEWVFASKGSFTSEHAIKGYEIFKEKYPDIKLIDSITYIFEIIYKENRIVVSYPNDDVILTGAWYRTIERELNIYTTIFDGFNRVKKYDGINDIKSLKSLIGDDQEGFVIQFHQSGVRAKIKGNEYVRLHRIFTNFSNLEIWEYLKNKGNFNDFLDRTPDEFDEWVNNVKNSLLKEYYFIEERAITLFEDFKHNRPGYDFESVGGKKEYSFWVKNQPKSLQPILFSMGNNKDYSERIWDMVRPKYQKPVWVKGDL